jgi:hypothetical protein
VESITEETVVQFMEDLIFFLKILLDAQELFIKYVFYFIEISIALFVL